VLTRDKENPTASSLCLVSADHFSVAWFIQSYGERFCIVFLVYERRKNIKKNAMTVAVLCEKEQMKNYADGNKGNF
jgi:hypothetical protein